MVDYDSHGGKMVGKIALFVFGLESSFVHVSFYATHIVPGIKTALPSPYSRIQITVRRASLSIGIWLTHET